MAFLYNIVEMDQELNDFQPLRSKMDTILKIKELHVRYIDVNEHWAELPKAMRTIEADDYGKEIAMIGDLKSKYIENLINIEQDEQAAQIGQVEPEAMDIDVPFNQLSAILVNIWSIEPITTVSKRKIGNIEYRVREEIAAMDELKIVRTPLIEQILVSFVITRLDVTSQVLFKWHLNSCAIFTAENLLNFLFTRKDGIEPYEVPVNDGASTSSAGPPKKRPLPKCPRCRGIHPLNRCPQFLTLTLEARRNTVIQSRLCHNCFSADHATRVCKNGDCKRCNDRHNSLLCPQLDDN